MKGFMKNLTTSNSKFKGQGRTLGSSSSSTPDSANSRLIPPPKPQLPDHNSNPKPNPRPQFSKPNPDLTPSPEPTNQFNCPICSSPFPSESEVSAHLDLCLTKNPDAESSIESTNVAESVSLYLSNQPPQNSVEVILRLLSNVVREPENEKFRRIRMGNPKIEEAIRDVKGGVELLECVGFRIGEEGGELWGAMDVPMEDGVRMIREAVSFLERWKDGVSKNKESTGSKNKESTGSGVEDNSVVERKTIDRKVRVFFAVPETIAAKIDLPDSFYNLSLDEIKRESELRKKKIAESQLLIPKSFKERQTISARKKYKLTVIRIQFPDGVVLQGIFLPSEPTTALYEFVSSSLKEPCLEFELLSPSVAKMRVIPRFTVAGDRRPPTLEEERLVPSALVKFKPIETDSILFTGLANELLEISEPLTSYTTVL